MAASRKKTDQYSNIISVSCTQSAANTTTFEEVDVGLNLFDKVGLLVHRMEIDPETNAITGLAAESDVLEMALTQSNSLSSLNITERAIIDIVRYNVNELGTAGNGILFQSPIERHFENLPGGGVLVAPKPLYVAIESSGFAAALTIKFRLYFTIVQLNDSDYFELLESRRFFG